MTDMTYDFDTTPSRRHTCCDKYDRCTELFGREDVIPMWIADMDFEIAPFITDAIIRRAEHKLYGYEFRDDAYNNAIKGWLFRRNGWKVESDWLRFSPGIVAGFSFAIRALSKEGDGVVVQPPIYPPFLAQTRLNGRRIIENPLRRTEDSFEIDFEHLDRCLADARILLMCNPHNPTGRVFTRAELEKVAELCRKHDVYIISDEIHSDLVFKPNKHLHIASLNEDAASRTVTFLAPSKTFNIAGLSTSVGVIPNPELRARFDAEFDKTHAGQGNTFGRVALQAAYAEGDQWLDQVLDYIKGNIDYMHSFIADNMPAIKTFRTEGTYLLWLDFSALGMSHEQLMHWLADSAHLGLNDGAEFGTQGVCCARLNAATSHAVCRKAMQQLLEAYRAL